MLRELAVVLCAAIIVSADPLHPDDSAAKNQLIQSTTAAPTQVTSRAIHEEHQVDQQQGKVYSPHVITYQNVPAPPNAYLPSSKLVSYEFKPAVVENLGTIGPIEVKGASNNNQQVVYTRVAPQPQTISVVPQYYPTPVTYATNAAPVRPYYAVPVAPKTVTVESRVQPSQVVSEVTYASNAAPARAYYSVPVAPKSVSIETPATVTPVPPVAQASYRVNTPVTYVNNVVAAKPYYSVPVAAKTVTVEAQPQPQAVRTVEQPAIHYVQAPIAYAPNPIKVVPSVPVASKTVAVEPAPQYVQAPQLVRYAPVAVPKPVPLVYQATGVETHHPATQQFTFFTKSVAPTAAPYKHEAVQIQPVQPIPVPVQYSAGQAVQYQSAPVPVVHAKSFVEKVYVPVGSTPAPAHEHVGYARAVSYSPASAVSRVTFNGLGVSYGW